VKTIRRTVLALTLAGIASAAIKLRGCGEVPTQVGGWRELSSADFK